MKKFKGFEKGDGTLVKEAWFDGYPFGDKLLEGVMFKATISDRGFLFASVGPASAAYFSSLSRKWLSAAAEYARDNDIFCEREDGGEEVKLVEDKDPKPVASTNSEAYATIVKAGKKGMSWNELKALHFHGAEAPLTKSGMIESFIRPDGERAWRAAKQKSVLKWVKATPLPEILRGRRD